MIRGGVISAYSILSSPPTHISLPPSLLCILQTDVCGGCVSKFDRPEIGNPEKEKMKKKKKKKKKTLVYQRTEIKRSRMKIEGRRSKKT